MTKHALNQTPSQTPLQESKNQNISLNRSIFPGKHNAVLAPHSNLIKLGQENAIPAESTPLTYSSQANTLVRKPGASISNDRAPPRNRIALTQKPLSSLNVPNIKSNHPPYHPTPHPLPKGKYLPYVTDANLLPTKAIKPGNPTNAEDNASVQAQAQTQVQSQTQLQSQSQSQTNNLVYGSQEWINGLVQSLPKYKFFFDGIDHGTTTKLTKILQIYNASVAMFFSSEVTHVVTTRSIPSKDAIARMKATNIKNQARSPSSSIPTLLAASNATPTPPGKLPPKAAGLVPASSKENIIFKAMSFGIHVWSLERVTKLLAPLMTEPIAPADNRNLQELLRREKMFGLTTNQTDEAIKAEYHTFKEAYLLVEDTTGHYRPILAQEYEYPKTSTARPPWPRVYIQRTDKTPFLHHKDRSRHSAKQTERAKENKEGGEEPKAANGNNQAIPLGFSFQGSPSVLASGLIHSVTSNIVSTNSAVGKSATHHGVLHGQDRVLEQLGKRILSATKGEAGVAPDLKRPEFVRPANIVKASKSNTIHESTLPKRNILAITNIDTTIADQPTHTKAVATLRPTPLIHTTPAATAVPAQNPLTTNVGAQGSLATPVPVVPVVTGGVPALVAPKVYFKQGYCENCRQHYVDFNKHIETPEHRKYAHDSTKFERLDRLLLQLQRKPKAVLKAPESDALAPDMTDHNQRSAQIRDVAVAEVATDTKIGRITNPPDSLLDKSLSLSAGQQGYIPSANTQTRDDLDCCTRPNAVNEGQPQGPQQGVTITSTDIVEEKNEACVVEIATVGNVVHDAISQPTQGNVKGIEHNDEVSDELSSELSRLDVSEVGEEEVGKEHKDGCLVNSATTRQPTQLKNVASAACPESGPPLKSTLGSQHRVPFSDRTSLSETNASQLETDVTQPDSQFLGGDLGDSQVTDPVAPIHLTICQEDLSTDCVEPSPTIEEDPFGVESASEEDRDGFDDAVALLKSPSAGRGIYARIQSINIGRAPVVPSTHLTLPKESFKRKLECAMAEDYPAENPCPVRPTALETLGTPRPIIYDDNLRSRLLSQQSRQLQQSASLHAGPCDSVLQSQHCQALQTIPPFSSPSQFEVQQIVPQSSTLPYHSTPNNSTKDITVPQSWNEGIYGYQTQSHLQQRRSDLQDSTSLATKNNRSDTAIGYSGATGASSPTADTSHEQIEHSRLSQSPISLDYSASGFSYGLPSSPSRSPSQRASNKVQRQFPVMTHAEQERERCYHHYRGNRLPEPAGGQKKMRSSSNLEDALEEYGEGCMVFIE
ncbi:hypothetical protein BGX27_009734 [Mortierella sp. AM989]|nr:hypothetical protein BGX27_009734 [Mortierella sp. AM989]